MIFSTPAAACTIFSSPWTMTEPFAERLDQQCKPTGAYIIALDGIGAGRGETVLILDEGSGARQILDDASAPVRSIVVGIVDEVDLGAG
jgi:microcompartment protein CcmK/EutM